MTQRTTTARLPQVPPRRPCRSNGKTVGLALSPLGSQRPRSGAETHTGPLDARRGEPLGSPPCPHQLAHPLWTYTPFPGPGSVRGECAGPPLPSSIPGCQRGPLWRDRLEQAEGRWALQAALLEAFKPKDGGTRCLERDQRG